MRTEDVDMESMFNIEKTCKLADFPIVRFLEILEQVINSRFEKVFKSKGWEGIPPGFRQRLIKDISGFIRVSQDLKKNLI